MSNINKFLSYDGLGYYDSKLKSYIKEENPIKKGLSEGSIQASLGENIAGLKGFYWQSINMDTNTVELGENRAKTVSGKWKFNETLNMTENDNYFEIVNYRSNNVYYMGFDLFFSPAEGPAVENYGLNFALSSEISTPNDVLLVHFVDGSDGGWIDEAYRTIDFGSTPQEVSEEFYNWFIANAEEIKSKTVSGVWQFKAMPSVFHDDFMEAVNFTSYGSVFSSMGVEGQVDVYYDDTHVYNEADEIWQDERYRVVDFGDEPQEVSEEFYTWFTSHAKCIPFDIADYWAVGDIISIHSDKKWINCATITAIDGNVITVDALPFTEPTSESGHITDQAVYVLAKPDKGIIDFGQNSIAFGEKCKAINYNTFTAGCNVNATVQNQAVFGSYNKENEMAIFQVGNGTSDTDRGNAFEVLSDGIAVNGVTLTSTQLQKLINFIDTIE